jgi:hypothetical protein
MNILIISYSFLDRDQRVYKQILYLKQAGYKVISMGRRSSGHEDVFIDINRDPSIPAPKFNLKNFSFKLIMDKIIRRVRPVWLMIALKIGFFNYYHFNTLKTKKMMIEGMKIDDRIDIIISNDIETLPTSVILSNHFNSKLYLDAHEFEPLHHNTFKFKFFYKRYWDSICKKYLKEVDYMTSVSDGIANEYSRRYNLNCEVMMNVPFYYELEPKECRSDKIKLVHHGIAGPGRKLENMIFLMSHLDERFELYFVLLKMETSYGEYLRELAKNSKKIHFLEPVLSNDVPNFINQFDMGIYLLGESTFNQKMALPNKIFQFIQARLGIIIWPSQEMVKIVTKYRIGLYSDDFNIKQIAKKINQLTTEDIMYYKRNSANAALVLNSEINKKKLLSIIKKLSLDL